MRSLSKLIGNLIESFRGTAPNAKRDKPVIVTASTQANREVTGRRAARYGTVLHVDDVAARLSDKKPFFKMRSGGVYAVGLARNRKGKVVPCNFIRYDKDRRPVKLRKRMRRAARKLAEATV